MSQENLRKKKIVVLCASVACMAIVVGPLARWQLSVAFLWLGVMVAALAYALMELVKLKRANDE